MHSNYVRPHKEWVYDGEREKEGRARGWLNESIIAPEKDVVTRVSLSHLPFSLYQSLSVPIVGVGWGGLRHYEHLPVKKLPGDQPAIPISQLDWANLNEIKGQCHSSHSNLLTWLIGSRLEERWESEYKVIWNRKKESTQGKRKFARVYYHFSVVFRLGCYIFNNNIVMSYF